jgi:hypothetical protein
MCEDQSPTLIEKLINTPIDQAISVVTKLIGGNDTIAKDSESKGVFVHFPHLLCHNEVIFRDVFVDSLDYSYSIQATKFNIYGGNDKIVVLQNYGVSVEIF